MMNGVMKMYKRSTAMILVISFLFLNIPVGLATEAELGQYFSLYDESGQLIHQTGLTVNEDDIYIAPDNTRYIVTKLDGYKAICRNDGQEEMPDLDDPDQQKQAFLDGAIPVLKKGRKPTIAVYHTHTDESYVPTDGKESIRGNGGIFDVGQTLVNELKKLGFNVVYSQNKHDPHDVNAYNRSRKTAASLLKKGPDAIIDVHRDAVPASVYKANVKGVDATKIKLVIGKSNPNMKTNMEFAKSIKAAMDKKQPGLSNGIFIGKGDYNQDLNPRAILIEVGSHTNPKGDAQQGVKLFANALPLVLGTTSNPAGTGAEAARKPMNQNNQGAGTAILIILGVAAAAVGCFYLINSKNTNK